MLKIYNTLGRELQEFKPINKDKVTIYQCGPTVYWTQHIGNMRAMVMGDLISRSLAYLGYEVELTRNYTDVGHLTDDGDQGEDKMEKGAKREGLTPQQIAAKYIDQFEADTSSLGVRDPEHKPKATDYVQSMIELTKILLDKGFAYSTPKAIYFDTSKAEDYTRLSGQKLEENLEGAGHGDVEDPDKKHSSDFSLWFFKTGKHRNAIQTWASPFSSPEVENGEGFPGWHIECSAMAKGTLGDTIDLHLGGVEHIPVHHTNEIAQSESANGQTFANYWLHYEHLTVDSKKMAKSDGNVYNLSDIVDKGYDPLVLRYFFLQAHYRSKQNFTWEALEASATGYSRLKQRISDLREAGELGEVSSEYQQLFLEKLSDDFNIPQALAIAWDMIKDQNLDDQTKLATILAFDQVLGLNFRQEMEETEVSDEVKEIISRRDRARNENDWDESDRLRDLLLNDFRIKVMDTPEGQKWQKA